MGAWAKDKRDTWRAANQDKISASRAQQRDGRRSRDLMRQYGITPEIYHALEIAQQGECAICGRAETRCSKNGKVWMLSLEHNHETGEIRGLVCANCNTMMGLAQDNPTYLYQAALYLENS